MRWLKRKERTSPSEIVNELLDLTQTLALFAETRSDAITRANRLFHQPTELEIDGIFYALCFERGLFPQDLHWIQSRAVNLRKRAIKAGLSIPTATLPSPMYFFASAWGSLLIKGLPNPSAVGYGGGVRWSLARVFC